MDFPYIGRMALFFRMARAKTLKRKKERKRKH